VALGWFLFFWCVIGCFFFFCGFLVFWGGGVGFGFQPPPPPPLVFVSGVDYSFSFFEGFWGGVGGCWGVWVWMKCFLFRLCPLFCWWVGWVFSRLDSCLKLKGLWYICLAEGAELFRGKKCKGMFVVYFLWRVSRFCDWGRTCGGRVVASKHTLNEHICCLGTLLGG